MRELHYPTALCARSSFFMTHESGLIGLTKEIQTKIWTSQMKQVFDCIENTKNIKNLAAWSLDLFTTVLLDLGVESSKVRADPLPF